MKHLLATLAAVTLLAAAHAEQPPAAFRPPGVPLVAHDPYFSCWSFNDRLTDDWARHWTGAVHAMCGLIRIDGRPFRYAGPQPADVPAMKQESLRVTPTQSIYTFNQNGLRLVLTFTTPALPADLDLLSRPVTYVTWELDSSDGKAHRAEVYFDVTAEWCVNTADQRVRWAREAVGELPVMRIGSAAQPVLAKAGDNLRIDWGEFYLAAPAGDGVATAMAADRAARGGFVQNGKLPPDDARMPRPANDQWPVLAFTADFGDVTVVPVSKHALLAYDDQYSIEHMGKKLRPWWRRAGGSAADLLRDAERNYLPTMRACRNLDERVLTELEKVGGVEYARLGALAYRQCLAAHKLVAREDGEPLYFSKENFSNGCIATVDVTYPSAPFFLLVQPKLLRAQLVPVLDYAASPRWKFPFAPHDLGTYPKANGQVYGGGEKTEKDQMPVEECGNMLILVAALAKAEGGPELAKAHWPVLTKWATYLKEKGLDPENQLCTDDFAGHLAHNTNLSAKAIVALGCYAQLCDAQGLKDDAVAYRKLAQDMAKEWVKMAADGDHFRLTFDKPGTWSQKYNLVWDRLLGLNLFPLEVARQEIAYYKTVQDRYGLPLDNRKAYTKLDWIFWTATLAEKPEDFSAFIGPVYRFANETKDRVPLTDWYGTKDAKQQGFQARSVVGGIYIKLLAEKWLTEKKK